MLSRHSAIADRISRRGSALLRGVAAASAAALVLTTLTFGTHPARAEDAYVAVYGADRESHFLYNALGDPLLMDMRRTPLDATTLTALDESTRIPVIGEDPENPDFKERWDKSSTQAIFGVYRQEIEADGISNQHEPGVEPDDAWGQWNYCPLAYGLNHSPATQPSEVRNYVWFNQGAGKPPVKAEYEAGRGHSYVLEYLISQPGYPVGMTQESWDAWKKPFLNDDGTIRKIPTRWGNYGVHGYADRDYEPLEAGEEVLAFEETNIISTNTGGNDFDVFKLTYTMEIPNSMPGSQIGMFLTLPAKVRVEALETRETDDGSPGYNKGDVWIFDFKDLETASKNDTSGYYQRFAIGSRVNIFPSLHVPGTNLYYEYLSDADKEIYSPAGDIHFGYPPLCTDKMIKDVEYYPIAGGKETLKPADAVTQISRVLIDQISSGGAYNQTLSYREDPWMPFFIPGASATPWSRYVQPIRYATEYVPINISPRNAPTTNWPQITRHYARHIAQYALPSGPDVKVEKYVMSESVNNGEPQRSNDDMAVCRTHTSDNIVERTYCSDASKTWEKGEGENPATEEGEKEQTDKGRHIVEDRAYDYPLDLDAQGRVKPKGPATGSSRIGFDIINRAGDGFLPPGLDLNAATWLKITDQTTQAEPAEWETSSQKQQDRRFTCDIPADAYARGVALRENGDQTIPDWTIESYDADGTAMLDSVEDFISIDPVTETPTTIEVRDQDGSLRPSVSVTSTWNPDTQQQELILDNIQLGGVSTDRAMTKIRCSIDFPEVAKGDIEPEEYLHHDKVSVFGRGSYPVIDASQNIGENNTYGEAKQEMRTYSDSDNFWARVQGYPEIDILAQVDASSDQNSPEGYYRHDFISNAGLPLSTEVAGKSESAKESFRISAGYQTRGKEDAFATQSDLENLRITPEVKGAPVKACSPIRGATLTKADPDRYVVKQVDKSPSGAEIAGTWVEDKDDPGHVYFVVPNRTAVIDIPIYLSTGTEQGVDYFNSLSMPFEARQQNDGSWVTQIGGSRQNLESGLRKGLQACTAASDTGQCQLAIGSPGNFVTLDGDTEEVEIPGFFTVTYNNWDLKWDVSLDRRGSLQLGSSFLSRDHKIPVTVNDLSFGGDSSNFEITPGAYQLDFGRGEVSQCQKRGSRYRCRALEPVEGFATIGDAIVEVDDPYVTDAMPLETRLWTQNSNDTVLGYVSAWKTTVTQGDKAQAVTFTKDNTSGVLSELDGKPTLTLNGTLQFDRTFTVTQDPDAGTYTFRVGDKETILTYDKVTRVPVDGDGKQIGGDITLNDGAQTPITVDTVAQRFFLDGQEYSLADLTEAGKEYKYQLAMPIRELTPREFGDYQKKTEKEGERNDKRQVTGCSPHHRVGIDEADGNVDYQLCDASPLQTKADSANAVGHQKVEEDTNAGIEDSHRFTAYGGEPTYGVELDGKTYLVETKAETFEWAEGSSCSDTPGTAQVGTVTDGGTINLFDDNHRHILPKDVDKFVYLDVESGNLASGAATYTQVSTQAEQRNNDKIVTSRTRASAEAAHRVEPTVEVEKKATSEPLSTTAQGVDVFEPGSTITVEASMANTGNSALTNIEFEDSSTDSPNNPTVDFAKNPQYSIDDGDRKVYVIKDGILYDQGTEEPISVAAGSTLRVYGTVTLQAGDMHGDEVRFTVGDLTQSDSYRATSDKAELLLQKVTASPQYLPLAGKVEWSECPQKGLEGKKCWTWKAGDDAAKKQWNADQENRLFLPTVKEGEKYFSQETPVSILVTNTGHSGVKDLSVIDTNAVDRGGKIDWSKASATLYRVTKNGDDLTIEPLNDVEVTVTAAVNADNPSATDLTITMAEGQEKRFLEPAEFDAEGAITKPGEFVVVTGVLPKAEIGDASEGEDPQAAHDHSNSAVATGTSVVTGTTVTSNDDDWNTRSVKPHVSVKKYSGGTWDPMGEAGDDAPEAFDAQTADEAVTVPVTGYNDNPRSATTAETDVKIVVTNDGTDPLSEITIWDESTSSVTLDGAKGTWSTTDLQCQNTPIPGDNTPGAGYVLEKGGTDEGRLTYSVSPALAPGHSVRCSVKLPSTQFDTSSVAMHADTVRVFGKGEKSQTNSNTAEDQWHASAKAADLSIIKYSGEYQDAQAANQIGTATGDANLGTEAVTVELSEEGKPLPLPIHYTIKNTGSDDLVKIKLAEKTLAKTVGAEEETAGDKWQVEDVTCDVSNYAGATQSPETISGTGELTVTFTDEAPLPPGALLNCHGELRYSGDVLPDDGTLLRHANTASTTGNGRTNREFETPGGEDSWHGRSGKIGIAAIKYINKWENASEWDGTKTGDLPPGDADTDTQRAPRESVQDAVLIKPVLVSGTGADAGSVTVPEQYVGYTVRNTGSLSLDRVDLKDVNFDGNQPAEFATEPITCTPGEDGLPEDATVTKADNSNGNGPATVTVTFAEKNPFAPGDVFTCHAKIPSVTGTVGSVFKHGDELIVNGYRGDDETGEVTDRAHSYSVSPSIEISKESKKPQDAVTGVGDSRDPLNPEIVKPVKDSDGSVYSQPVTIVFTVTNNGSEALTLKTLRVTDQLDPATAGKITFDGDGIGAATLQTGGASKSLTRHTKACEGKPVEDCAVVTFSDPAGEVTSLGVGESIVFEGILAAEKATAMGAGEVHHDVADVVGTGEESELETRDEDEYYGKTVSPKGETNKYSNVPGKIETLNSEKKNNSCDDAPGSSPCKIPNAKGKVTSAAFTIKMDYTNRGSEDLTKVTIVDTTTKGTAATIAHTAVIGEVGLTGAINGKTVYLNPGDNVFYDDESFQHPSVLPIGHTLRILAEMPQGALDKSDHSDVVRFEAHGVYSELPTGDTDSYTSTWTKTVEVPRLVQTGAHVLYVGYLALIAALTGGAFIFVGRRRLSTE